MKKDVLIQNRSIAEQVLPTLPAIDEDFSKTSRRASHHPPAPAANGPAQ